ncbi:MAG: hypothetical protein Kow006_07230 [Gammaproteobacteria bacterium]
MNSAEALIEVRLSGLPDCWESCGNCADGELMVVEWLVEPGERVRRFDPILVAESDKTTYEIPSQADGLVVERCVAVGDRIGEHTLLLRLRSPR